MRSGYLVTWYRVLRTFLDTSPFTSVLLSMMSFSSDKYIFLAPSQMNLSIVWREVKNEHRRLELFLLFLYIDYRLGSHPSIRCKISIGPQPEQYNLTISILITTMSSPNYKGSHTMKMNRYKALGQ